jgi:hypothetical protein
MRPVLLLALAGGMLAAADAPAFTCKPVMVTACGELPASIGFTDRPMGYELGFKVTYLIEGQDLIGFKEDSLQVSAITTADGKELAKKRNGKPAWKQGSFPKTTDDGRYGIFTVEVAENLFGKTDGVGISGSIVALSGSDRQTKKLAMKASEAKVEDVGGLKVTLVGDKKDKGAGAAAPKPFFGGGGFGVQVSGDIGKIAEVVVLDGDAKLDSQGSSWSGTQRTWNFAKPAGDSVTVEITWWNKMSSVTVPFGKK